MPRTLRRITLAAVCGAFVLLAAAPAVAQSGGLCQLDGTATITPGLSNTDRPFTYTFTGNLSGCQSNVAGAPASGTVEVGQVWTEPSGQQFQEAPASGSGTCASGTSTATGIAKWADGTRSVISFTTQAVTGAVNLQGTVVPSVTIPAINPLPGQPTSLTITSTRYSGDSVQGALGFEADPALCASTGVTSAAVKGVAGIGHS